MILAVGFCVVVGGRSKYIICKKKKHYFVARHDGGRSKVHYQENVFTAYGYILTYCFGFIFHVFRIPDILGNRNERVIIPFFSNFC